MTLWLIAFLLLAGVALSVFSGHLLIDLAGSTRYISIPGLTALVLIGG